MDIGYLAVDTHVWGVKSYLMRKYGCDAADRMISPLTWYISTGRASAGFLRAFMATKAYVIGRILANGGSDDEVILAIRRKLKLD